MVCDDCDDCVGVNRESLEIRLQFANDILDDVIDSADHPLTVSASQLIHPHSECFTTHTPSQGRRWWQSGDDPWQVLACCIEITNAVRSCDPQSFVSHLPVHQVTSHPLQTHSMCVCV